METVKEIMATKLARDLLHAADEYRRRLEEGGRWDLFTKTCDPTIYVKEFRTLRLGGPRQFGNSAAVATVAKRQSAGLVVVSQISQASVLRERHEGARFSSILSVQQVKNRVTSIESDTSDHFGPFNDIVVDGASFIEAKHPDFLDVLAGLLNVESTGWLVLIG
jgi:hypothetical protein